MKKVLIICLVLLSVCFGAKGQYYYGLSGYYDFPRTEYVTDSLGNIRFKPGDMGFSMQAGAFAGSNFHGSSWFGTSLSPALAYNVTGRFRLKAGVTIFQSFGNPAYNGYDGFYRPYDGNNTTTGIFIQGDYILNNKLTISGAFYKYFSPQNIGINDPRYKSPDGESYLLNLNYHPIGNFEINATFEYSNGAGINHYDPFYQPGLFSPGPGH
jgi:hypothetical protein